MTTGHQTFDKLKLVSLSFGNPSTDQKGSLEAFNLLCKTLKLTMWAEDVESCSTSVGNPAEPSPKGLSLWKMGEDLLIPEDAAFLKDIRCQVLESGAEVRTDVTLLISGEKRWIDIVAEPLYGNDGNIHEIAFLAQDITGRKHVEEVAELERQRSKSVVDYCPAGILVVDSQEKVVYANLERERIYGHRLAVGEQWASQMKGITLRKPDCTKYESNEYPMVRALSNHEKIIAEEVILEYPGEHNKLVMISAAPIFSSNGEFLGGVAATLDITRIEEEEKLRNDFLAMVSQELRRPISAIKGAAVTALTDGAIVDRRDSRQLFRIIDDEADRLSRLVSNLMDLTRIEAGALTVTPKSTDLKTLLQEIVSRFTGEKDREVKLDLPIELPPVNCDSARISQVLENLLNNSVKFSPSETPIEVQTECGDSQVIIRIRDYGLGIPRDKLGYLFKKFSRLNEAASGELSDTGLGLTISKGIVEAHGGRIWAESRGEGFGSTFSFTLPITHDSVVFTLIDPQAKEPLQEETSRVHGLSKILVVGDDPHAVRYISRLLKQKNYRVIALVSPAEVVDTVALEKPNLVLLDLVMSGTDGFKVLKHIREFSGVPAIVLTARDKESDKLLAFKAGADDYIVKPFSPSELLARIEAITKRRQGEPQSDTGQTFIFENLKIDLARRRAILAGKEVALSPTEYKLLHYMGSNAGKLLTYDQILNRVWGPQYGGELELLRTAIRRLRRKLGDSARNQRYILTEPQVGYWMPSIHARLNER